MSEESTFVEQLAAVLAEAVIANLRHELEQRVPFVLVEHLDKLEDRELAHDQVADNYPGSA